MAKPLRGTYISLKKEVYLRPAKDEFMETRMKRKYLILLAALAIAAAFIPSGVWGRPCDDTCERSSSQAAAPTATPADSYPGAPPDANVVGNHSDADTYPGKPPEESPYDIINTLPLNITGGAVFVQIVVEQYRNGDKTVYSINKYVIDNVTRQGFAVYRSDGLFLVNCSFFIDDDGNLQVAAPPGWSVTYR